MTQTDLDAVVAEALALCPVIDGHNDWAWENRINRGYSVEGLDAVLPTDTDIPRLRRGGVGAQFWSVFVEDEGNGALAVQQTLEQIDWVHRLVARYPHDFELARTAADIVHARANGRIACLLGAEVSRVLNNTDLMYFSGADEYVLPSLAIGATGLVGVTANIAPRPYRQIIDAVNAGDLATATAVHKKLEPLARAVMTHVPGTVAAKYILHGLGRIGSPRVRLPLVGPEDFEAAQIEGDLDLVHAIDGLDLTNFRPDRNAAAGGALPKVAGTTR